MFIHDIPLKRWRFLYEHAGYVHFQENLNIHVHTWCRNWENFNTTTQLVCWNGHTHPALINTLNEFYLMHSWFVFLCHAWFYAKLCYIIFHVMHVFQKEHCLIYFACFISIGQIWTQHLSLKEKIPIYLNIEK
jgi:hypothetical protein